MAITLAVINRAISQSVAGRRRDFLANAEGVARRERARDEREDLRIEQRLSEISDWLRRRLAKDSGRVR